MKTNKNVVITKDSHSRTSLSGIYNACRCQIKGISLLNRCVEDPRVLRTAKSGMTPNLMGFTLRPSSSRSVSMRDIGAAPRGFTLIELLVVVLIIGILAAVAVPQYQKAVFKAHMAEGFTNLKTLADAVHVCELAHNGKAPTLDNPCVEFDNLDIELGKRSDNDNFIAGDNGFETDSFEYAIDRGGYNSVDTVAIAKPKKYDVCLCLHDDGSMAVMSGDGCEGTAPSFDVNTVLGIEDDDCYCC